MSAQAPAEQNCAQPLQLGRVEVLHDLNQRQDIAACCQPQLRDWGAEQLELQLRRRRAAACARRQRRAHLLTAGGVKRRCLHGAATSGRAFSPQRRSARALTSLATTRRSDGAPPPRSKLHISRPSPVHGSSCEETPPTRAAVPARPSPQPTSHKLAGLSWRSSSHT